MITEYLKKGSEGIPPNINLLSDRSNLVSLYYKDQNPYYQNNKADAESNILSENTSPIKFTNSTSLLRPAVFLNRPKF